MSVGQSLIPLVNKIQDVLLHAGLHHGNVAGSSPRSLKNETSGSSPSQRSPRLPSSQALTKNLPVIAVIGSQSSGKSSLLESLVGTDFLPKSTEICTRCPLVLQLVQSSGSGDDSGSVFSAAHSPPYGEFLHRRGRKYYDFAQVKEEILAETERVIGKGSVRVSDGASCALFEVSFKASLNGLIGWNADQASKRARRARVAGR